jgi:hypothetical protein
MFLKVQEIVLGLGSERLAGVSNDGTAAMVGEKNYIISLLQREETNA